jgi:hypothetical protein
MGKTNLLQAMQDLNEIFEPDAIRGLLKDSKELSKKKSTKELRSQTEEIELIDRGLSGRILYLPKELRDYIYVDLDMDDIFGHLALQTDERGIKDATQMRLFKNKASPNVLEFLYRMEEIKERHEEEFAQNGWANKTVEREFPKLMIILDEEMKIASEGATGTSYSVIKLLHHLRDKNRRFVHKAGDSCESDVFFKAETCDIKESMFGKYLLVCGQVMGSDGRNLASSTYVFKLPYFDGMKEMSELGLEELTADHKDYQYFVERGKKYMSLVVAPSYQHYSSNLVRKNWRGNVLFKAKGRVMVDMASMMDNDPNYGDYQISINSHNSRQICGLKEASTWNFTDDQYAMMIPYVYGFSFISKTWGEMKVDDISDIKFRDDAWDNLVLDPDKKSLIRSLVESGVDSGLDIIDNKGGGIIFLLSGPPGTGKTTSAETVAEVLHKPLYMVGVGELGTDVSSLEENLRSILNIAQEWNAVLLIDECDIFMEARTDNDIDRNAMVGVFLRLLEYYSGVLFLTSNRAGNIDQAFYSRITMSLHYDQLDVASRKQIWANLLGLYKTKNVDLDVLAKHQMNGRRIKNVIRIASSIASFEKREIEIQDLERVIELEKDFSSKAFVNSLTQVKAGD